MSCIPAPTCRAALAELDRKFPGRDRSSDGICASSAHHSQNPSSDHETGDAFDATHDPAHGFDSYKAADWLRTQVLSGAETRVKYIISNRRIFNPTISDAWRHYGGSNPHDHHCHISLRGGPYSPATVRDDLSSWWAGFGEQEALVVTPEDEQKIADIVDERLKKSDVLLIQVIKNGVKEKVGIDVVIKAMAVKNGVMTSDGTWVGP